MSAVRTLDRRTLTICACIALIAACAAGLVAWAVLDDGTSSASPSDVTLVDRGEDTLMTTELDVPDGAAPTNLEVLGGGKPMLVNFWQSTCAPCIAEMPLLEEARRANPEVVFVGVATQDRAADAARFATETGITYPWVLDTVGDAFHLSEGTGMPTTVLIDERGEVVDRHSGAYRDLAQIQSSIDEHLG